LATLVALWPRTAYGYLDPATGGFLLQIVFGGIAGVLVAIRLFWGRLKSTFLSVKNLVKKTDSRGGDKSGPEQ
jgi:hypothetical protein